MGWICVCVDYCDVFISCLDFHSDGTHSLQRIHWWASDAKFLQIGFNEEAHLQAHLQQNVSIKKLNLDGLRVSKF